MQSRNSVSSALKDEVKGLSPAYFAMVMATGIVSIAGHLLGMRLIAVPLFWLNIGAYLLLWILSVLRLISYPHQFLGDLIDHQRGPGFFTVVAASCILGSQFLLISGSLIYVWRSLFGSSESFFG